MTLNNLPELQLCRITTERLGLVNRFYKANGHKGKCGRDDLVFTAGQTSSILAAVRFTAKSEGYLLRGLWVAVDQRGKTIGKRLLDYSLQQFHSPVWCYPYQHLVSFYNKCGFQEVHADQIPDDIASPWEAYRSCGETFALMQHLPAEAVMQNG